jgi:hypothetical protein
MNWTNSGYKSDCIYEGDYDQDTDHRSKVICAIFGKGVLAIALEDKIYYGYVEEDKATRNKQEPYVVTLKSEYSPDPDNKNKLKI